MNKYELQLTEQSPLLILEDMIADHDLDHNLRYILFSRIKIYVSYKI